MKKDTVPLVTLWQRFDAKGQLGIQPPMNLLRRLDENLPEAARLAFDDMHQRNVTALDFKTLNDACGAIYARAQEQHSELLAERDGLLKLLRRGYPALAHRVTPEYVADLRAGLLKLAESEARLQAAVKAYLANPDLQAQSRNLLPTVGDLKRAVADLNSQQYRAGVYDWQKFEAAKNQVPPPERIAEHMQAIRQALGPKPARVAPGLRRLREMGEK